MTEFNLIQIAIAILFLPLTGFVFVLFFGKKIKSAYLVEVGILTLTFILTAVLLFSKLSWFADKNIVSEFSWISYQNIDRKSTRLNSSHRCISYAVFCLKK